MGLVSTSDFNTRFDLSYSRDGIDMNTYESYRWVGYVDVLPGASYASLDIITPSRQKGKADRPSLIIPGGSFIQQVSFKPLGNLTLAAATGKLKLATAVDAATATLISESAAAVGGTLTKVDNEYATRNITPVTVGTSDVIYKIFATNGATVASTVTTPTGATASTRILVMVSFVKFCRFPTEIEISSLSNFSTP